jgi:hypothetical protein
MVLYFYINYMQLIESCYVIQEDRTSKQSDYYGIKRD